MLSFKIFNLITFFFGFNPAKIEKKPGNCMGIARLFKRKYSGVGCGRSSHRLAAIKKTADVLVDFIHDMHLHPLADMTAVGTHEQTVLYQTAKLRALPCLQCRQSDSQEKNPCRWNIPHSGLFLYTSYIGILKVLRWRCGWGRPTLPFVLLGAVKKMCRMLSPAHAFCSASSGFSAFGFLRFRGGDFLLRLFCRLLFFGFLGCFLFRFLHFLYPFFQTFMPFLIFFLVGGFGKSVLVGKVHVCEVP